VEVEFMEMVDTEACQAKAEQAAAEQVLLGMMEFLDQLAELPLTRTALTGQMV
jgi:hypothetical protein